MSQTGLVRNYVPAGQRVAAERPRRSTVPARSATQMLSGLWFTGSVGTVRNGRGGGLDRRRARPSAVRLAIPTDPYLGWELIEAC